MSLTYLTNCRLVLPDATIDDAGLLIESERIAAICPTSGHTSATEWDLNGATVMPGLIDLHSDAIESLAEPRSGIYLPFDLAAAQADQLAASCGITTFFNAVSFAGEELGLRKEDAPARLVQAINDFRPFAQTDQRVHCRYEVTVGHALPKILDFIESGSCGIVSYMDHSPGQGQFQNEENYRNYVSARYGYDDETITKLLKSKLAEVQNPEAIRTRTQQLAAKAEKHGIPFAGHDADSAAHVQEMAQLGAVLAEFPMSEEAALAGEQHGLHQLVGSVNVIRGGSQRTGMSAAKLIQKGQADCLCSDYVPATLLPALHKMSIEHEIPMHQIAKIATANPAKAASLHDRGEIKEGLRADLIAWEHSSGIRVPRVAFTWVRGKLVYASTDLPTGVVRSSLNTLAN